MTITALSALALLPLLAGQPQPAPASRPATVASADPRWAAWLGCWRAEDDDANRGARLCVLPRGEDGGVTLLTLVGAQRISEEARIADAVTRPIGDVSCTGTERVSWSDDGRRLFRTADVTCPNEAPRHLSSVSFVTDGPTLIDVQTVADRDATNVRVRRYRPAAAQSLPDGAVAPRPTGLSATAGVSGPWTIDEVVEASAMLPAVGVQAAIAESPTAFALDATGLRRLAAAAVAEPVIDLMVALTYPARFSVERTAAGGASGGGVGTGWMDPFFSPILGAASLYDCYSPYGWAASSYWRQCSGYDSAFFYRYPGFYNGYYGIAPGGIGGWVPAPPGGDPDASVGRVVNARGYVQVRPVETPSSIGGGTSGAQDSPSNSGGSSNGGASTGGYSSGSGGGGGDGGRYAVPRPPGGQ